MKAVHIFLFATLLGAISAEGTRAQTDLETAVSHLQFREIGPALMGGRIADLAVVEAKPQVFYIGTASGGVWKTVNHGTSWTPLFDDQPNGSIGDVTLHQANPNLIWVGTGEPQTDSLLHGEMASTSLLMQATLGCTWAWMRQNT